MWRNKTYWKPNIAKYNFSWFSVLPFWKDFEMSLSYKKCYITKWLTGIQNKASIFKQIKSEHILHKALSFNLLNMWYFSYLCLKQVNKLELCLTRIIIKYVLQSQKFMFMIVSNGFSRRKRTGKDLTLLALVFIVD